MEKKIFPKNYLTDVVLQVDFNNPVTLTTEMIQGVHKALPFEKKEFKEQSIKILEFKIDKDNEAFNIHQVGKSGTYFINDNAEFPVKFIIDNSKFLLSVSKYSRFSSFFEIFLRGFDTFQNINRIPEFKRIGLRYINIFALDDEDIKTNADWKEFINPAFIPDYSNVKISETDLTLRRSMNRYYLGDGETFINVYMGIWNKSFPGMITDKEFILDMDCYVDNKILSESDITVIPKAMNEKAYKCFFSLLTDKLKSKLEG